MKWNKEYPKPKVLIIGYGSAGKRHTKNLINLEIKPYILTNHKDDLDAVFVNDIRSIKPKIDYCIISSQTSSHLHDLERCLTLKNIPSKFLIEKPIECSYERGNKIKEIAKNYDMNISIGYNLRFLLIFKHIKKFIREEDKNIRIVEIVAGENLRDWRIGRDYKEMYSAFKNKGGGVDLDLSHEIDYALWLFGRNYEKTMVFKEHISNLKTDSNDICKVILKYKTFVIDITLDYIRNQKERYINILCENGKHLNYNFVSNVLKIDDKTIKIKSDSSHSSELMMKDFLKNKKNIMCTIEESLKVLSVLETNV